MISPTRIHLVVTGDAEFLALPKALSRVFDAEFTVQQVPGFTSAPLAVPAAEASRATDLVDALLAAIDVGPTRQPADFAVALDDLELVNADRIGAVLAHVRKGVDLAAGGPAEVELIQRGRRRQYRHLATPEARAEALRTRCSFHLAAPMLESWFFGEEAALSRAGVRDLSFVKFDKAARDIEDFETDDPDFLAPDVDEPYWALGEPKVRGRHPKRYLSYLVDPTCEARRRHRYKERRNGKAALESLSWSDVVSPRRHARMLSAFLGDLASMLEMDLPFDLGEVHPLLALRGDGCLRNIATQA